MVLPPVTEVTVAAPPDFWSIISMLKWRRRRVLYLTQYASASIIYSTPKTSMKKDGDPSLFG